MVVTRVIRYRTSPEFADENEQLIKAVFAELVDANLSGLRYEVFRLEDEVSFVHVATFDDASNPLAESRAFREFQAEIGTRCVDGPTLSDASTIGSYVG